MLCFNDRKIDRRSIFLSKVTNICEESPQGRRKPRMWMQVGGVHGPVWQARAC